MSDSMSVVSASPADSRRLVDFLAVNFFPCEPLNLAINEAVGRVVHPINVDFEYVLGYLPKCLSLMAVEGDDIIGVAIGREITSEDHVARAEIIANVKAQEDKAFYNFYGYVDREVGFWEEDGPQKALELHVLAVSVEARGRGVGKTLIEATRNLAREKGYQLFRMDCTGVYSARLAELVGMTCVYSLPYEEFNNVNGEIVLRTPEPHKVFKVFKQKL